VQLQLQRFLAPPLCFFKAVGTTSASKLPCSSSLFFFKAIGATAASVPTCSSLLFLIKAVATAVKIEAAVPAVDFSVALEVVAAVP
jgi:hypothetical protein